jgi:quinol monooxygenase YgiN
LVVISAVKSSEKKQKHAPALGKVEQTAKGGIESSKNIKREVHKYEKTARHPAASYRREDYNMAKLAIWAVMESKQGKENEVEEFLQAAQPLAEKEAGTLTWYALKLGPTKFAIFDTFAAEEGREAHLAGEIAKELMAKAPDLFAKDPEIHKVDVLAFKAHLSGRKQKSARA